MHASSNERCTMNAKPKPRESPWPLTSNASSTSMIAERTYPFTVKDEAFVFLHHDTLEAAKVVPYSGRMATWDGVYYRLRANVDGLRSEYGRNPPDLTSDSGTGVYEHARCVVSVVESGRRLVVESQDHRTDERCIHEADIVVAAESSHSALRGLFEPVTVREYQGYVLWRGTAPVTAMLP
ncbi:hypothetical protein BAUCODRAFT_27474 [Baudoinia panamericana UAMH 10762]|uniref:FAD dependent oxidoreductase domain-containing protein n=1 Tax=Baudoinia panamericana (strain UAMH 10762) TaxID=717646 RepID=M2MZN0_BAUPA|nr:uncharacterized protein BAUCODRAFT_27474 [Baudoinia panamericana UAMH 10762]EMC92124.1 hypothetical protein BAUCODRAFT_27474 [Baudoinia panamericana UAMH 10762]